MLGNLVLEKWDLALEAHVPGEVRRLYVDPQFLGARHRALLVRLRRSSGTDLLVLLRIVTIVGP